MNVTASTIRKYSEYGQLHFSDKTVNNYRLATDTATIDGKYNDTPALNASQHWAAGREPCRGEIPVMLAATDSLMIVDWGYYSR